MFVVCCDLDVGGGGLGVVCGGLFVACGETLLARRPLYLVILLILSDFCFLFRKAVNTFLSASICVGLRLN
jgi:hypothetical protein